MNQQLASYYDYVEVETIETYTVIQQTHNQNQVQETFLFIISITALIMIIIGFILGFICSRKMPKFQIKQIVYRIYHHCIPDFINQILNTKPQIQSHSIPPKILNLYQSSQQDNIQTQDHPIHSDEQISINQSQIKQLSLQHQKIISSQNLIQQSKQNHLNKDQDYDQQNFNQYDIKQMQVLNYNQINEQIDEIQENNQNFTANQIQQLRENLLQEKVPINENSILRKQTITQFESKVEEDIISNQIIKTEITKNLTIYERKKEQDNIDIKKYNINQLIVMQKVMDEQIKQNQQQEQQLAIEWEHNQKDLFETGRFVKQFQQRQLIGQGGFGLVYKAFHIFEKKWYAVKQIYIAVNKHERIEDIKEITEVSSMNQLQHANIVRYHCMWIEDLNEDIKNKFLSNQHQLITEESLSQSQSQLQTSSQNVHNINDYGFQWEHSQPHTQLNNSQNHDQEKEVQDKQDDDDDYEEEEEQSDSFVYDKRRNNTNFKQSNISFVDELTNNRELLKNIQKNARNQKVTIVLNIQMQYIDGHTLFDYLKQRKEPNRTLHFHIFVQLIKGLQYLHSQDIIHRDIKPANIFIDQQQQVKIGDFGLAKNMMGSNKLKSDQSTEESLKISQQCIHTGVKGTPLYLAPEIENEQNYSKKVDIFSLGLVLLELISEGFGSFHEKKSVFDNIKNGIINQETLKTFNQESLLVLKMTDKDQYKRPSAKEILESQELLSLQRDLQIQQNQFYN